MYTVEVKANDCWTWHSEHSSYIDAVYKASLIDGRVADIDIKSDAFNSGFQTALKGGAEFENPYQEDTWEYLNWNAGYEDGE